MGKMDYQISLLEIEEAVDRLALGTLGHAPVSYTHLRAHETVLDLVCRLLLEKKKTKNKGRVRAV